MDDDRYLRLAVILELAIFGEMGSGDQLAGINKLLRPSIHLRKMPSTTT